MRNAICHKCFCHSATPFACKWGEIRSETVIRQRMGMERRKFTELMRSQRVRIVIVTNLIRQNISNSSAGAPVSISFSVPHSNVLVGSFPIFRNTCLVWGNFKVRNAQLSPPWTFLWFRNDITGDRVRVCVRWLSSIWNDHHEPEHQPTNLSLSLSQKQSKSHICVCEMHIYGTQSHIESVPIYANVIAR